MEVLLNEEELEGEAEAELNETAGEEGEADGGGAGVGELIDQSGSGHEVKGVTQGRGVMGGELGMESGHVEVWGEGCGRSGERG